MKSGRLLRAIVPLVLLAVAAGVVVALARTKSAPQKGVTAEEPTPVEVIRAEPESVAVVVEARGRVQPAKRITVTPDVPGPVAWTAEQLMPGGHFEQGELILRIDPTEYQLAVEARQGELSRARVEVLRAENQQEISEKAWELYRAERPNIQSADPPLVLNVPQLEAARQGQASAKSRVEQARLNLNRTAIRAPFNAVVASERVDVGQRVSPAQQLLTLVGSDQFWVHVSVEVEDLNAIRLPVAGDADAGSPARIRYATRSGTTVREGRVVRLQPDLDSKGSMARVLVSAEDPLGLEEELSGPPLLIGAFVDVEIRGKRLESVFRVPKKAVHENNDVWMLGDDDRLVIRQVEVIRRQKDAVLVASGLQAGDRIVTSAVPLPVEGMKLTAKSAESP